MTGRFVIDNSVVMTWCFEDEADAYADMTLENLANAVAVVPAIWPLEVANVLLVAERRQRLHEADSVRFLALLRQLPITVDRTWQERLMKEWLAIGRAHDLSSYDAAYLELAMRHGLPLATLDHRLRAAAARVDVPLLETS